MVLASNIRNYRKQRGYTQKELAILLGVSRESVVKYELDQSKPSIESLIILAELFDVSLDHLVLGKKAYGSKLDQELEIRMNALGGRNNLLMVLDAVISVLSTWKKMSDMKGRGSKTQSS